MGDQIARGGVGASDGVRIRASGDQTTSPIPQRRGAISSHSDVIACDSIELGLRGAAQNDPIFTVAGNNVARLGGGSANDIIRGGAEDFHSSLSVTQSLEACYIGSNEIVTDDIAARVVDADAVRSVAR